MKTKADVKRTLAISLSKPGKMPCSGWSLPAIKTCPTGTASIRKYGTASICSSCYARKGNYRFSNVQAGLDNRLKATKSPLWIEAMTILIGSDPYFRWHDSGDIYSLSYFKKIITVCELTPNTRHWLPTREEALIQHFIDNGGRIPFNLTIRISGLLKDVRHKSWLPVSNVVSSKTDNPYESLCRATFDPSKKTCGTCRKCWDPCLDIVYKAH